jgi:anti-anti-sigma factor
VTLVLVGDLDIASAAETARLIREAELDGPLVVDLREVDFIDSSGLRQLLSLRNDAKRNGNPLTLVAPAASEARRIFRLTGTRGLFNWADDA